MRRTGVSVIFAVLLALAWTHNTSAQSDRIVRLVTGNDYAPYTDEGLPEGGLINELVKRVYERMGVRYTIEWKPWKRGYQEGASGAYLATYPYVFNEERDELYAYSEPIFTSQLKFFHQIGAGPQLQSLDDAIGRRVCLPLGWAPGHHLQGLFESGAILRDEPPDMETCFRLLERARTEFVLANEVQGWESARAADVDLARIVAADFDVEINPLYVIFSRKAPDFEQELRRFDRALAELRASGEYDLIVEKHLVGYR